MSKVTVFSDAYPGADGALGANYFAVTGTLAIVSNRVRQSTVAGAPAWVTYINALASANQFARVTWPTYSNTQFLYLFVRFDGPNDNGYGVEISSDYANFVSYASGTPTVLGAGGGVTVGAGDTLELSAVDDLLTLYQNDTPVLTQTDSTYASGGSGGYGMRCVGSVASIEADDFATGIITSGAVRLTGKRAPLKSLVGGGLA